MCNPSNADIRKARGLKIACDEYFYIRGHLDFIYLVTDRFRSNQENTCLRGYNKKAGEVLVDESCVIFIEELN
jgi:hypothetical protein